jgi:hypothetical protein
MVNMHDIYFHQAPHLSVRQLHSLSADRVLNTTTLITQQIRYRIHSSPCLLDEGRWH